MSNTTQNNTAMSNTAQNNNNQMSGSLSASQKFAQAVVVLTQRPELVDLVIKLGAVEARGEGSDKEAALDDLMEYLDEYTGKSFSHAAARFITRVVSQRHGRHEATMKSRTPEPARVADGESARASVSSAGSAARYIRFGDFPGVDEDAVSGTGSVISRFSDPFIGSSENKGIAAAESVDDTAPGGGAVVVSDGASAQLMVDSVDNVRGAESPLTPMAMRRIELEYEGPDMVGSVSSGSEMGSKIGGFSNAIDGTSGAYASQPQLRAWLAMKSRCVLPKRCAELGLVTTIAVNLGPQARAAHKMLALLGDAALTVTLARYCVAKRVRVGVYQAVRGSAFSNSRLSAYFFSSGLRQLVVVPGNIDPSIGRVGSTAVEAIIGMVAVRSGLRCVQNIVAELLEDYDEALKEGMIDMNAECCESGNWSDEVQEEEELKTSDVAVRECLFRYLGRNVPRKCPELALAIRGGTGLTSPEKELSRMISSAGNAAIACAFAADCWKAGVSAEVYQRRRTTDLSVVALGDAMRRSDLCTLVHGGGMVNWQVNGVASKTMNMFLGVMACRMELGGVRDFGRAVGLLPKRK